MANHMKENRNEGVVKDRQAGMKWKAIAEKWGVYNETYAQRIYKTHVNKFIK